MKTATELADRRPYKPESVELFDAFMAHFCEHCRHEALCVIPVLAMLHEPGDAKFPEQWQSWQDADGRASGCSAFQRPLDLVLS